MIISLASKVIITFILLKMANIVKISISKNIYSVF